MVLAPFFRQFNERNRSQCLKISFFDPMSEPNVLAFELSLSFDIGRRVKNELLNLAAFCSSYLAGGHTDIFFADSASTGNQTPESNSTYYKRRSKCIRPSYESKKTGYASRISSKVMLLAPGEVFLNQFYEVFG